MPDSAAQLFWGILFSSVGLGYFLYGKKQQRMLPLLCGLALMVYPYLVSNTLALVGLGVLLSAVPYFIRF